MKCPSLIYKWRPTLYEQIFGKKPPKTDDIVENIVSKVESEKQKSQEEEKIQLAPIIFTLPDPKK